MLLWVGTLLVAFNIVIGLRVYRATAASGEESDSGYEDIAVFTRALQLIRQDYVDDEKVSYHDLTYSALRGMLAELDPHSQFMEPEDFGGMQEDTRGSFGGLGIVVAVRDGKLTVVTPMEDTPGFDAGLLPGDRIMKIDGESTEKMTLEDAIQLLRGEVGEVVTLTIYRASNNEVKEVPIKRAVIKVASVKDAKILPSEIAGDHKIGYVRITQFNEPTAKDLSKKLDMLEEQGMEALVLDLRYNPGGLLNSAVDVCAEFLPENELVVFTEGRTPSQRREYRTPGTGKPYRKYPIAVLINGGSASGSEIVAGALKDLNRAILVGETTFGKGSVQSVMPLQDGSALRLTTAKYYTPSKQVIHEHGVAPTIRATMSPQEERMLLMKRREDYLDEADTKMLDDFRDVPLQRAVDALRGVMIYVENAPPPTVMRATAVN